MAFDIECNLWQVEWGNDLQSEHERYLSEKVFNGTPLVVTDYPKGVREREDCRLSVLNSYN